MTHHTLLFCITACVFATISTIFRSPLFGEEFSLVPVTEIRRDMSAGLFSSADPAMVKKYMPEGKAPSTITSYALFAGNDVVLIDAALGGMNWVAEIKKLKIDPQKVKLVLLTHMHGDHVGGLLDGDARRFPNAVVRVSKPEYDFWYDRKENAKTPQLEKIKKAYGDDIVTKTFGFDDTVFSNVSTTVKAMNAVGHTPGHTAYLIESKLPGKKRMLVIADLIHAAALQFPVPEACASYDVDPAEAVKARKRILDFAVEQKLPIAGMHLPIPCIGRVESDAHGGYTFTPNP